MAATNKKLYIKAGRSIELTKQEVTLGDVLSMECTDQTIVTRLKTERLLKMPEQGQNRFVFSILKVIEQIHRYIRDWILKILVRQNLLLLMKSKRLQERRYIF